jgi:hypothetical protein
MEQRVKLFEQYIDSLNEAKEYHNYFHINDTEVQPGKIDGEKLSKELKTGTACLDYIIKTLKGKYTIKFKIWNMYLPPEIKNKIYTYTVRVSKVGKAYQFYISWPITGGKYYEIFEFEKDLNSKFKAYGNSLDTYLLRKGSTEGTVPLDYIMDTTNVNIKKTAGKKFDYYRDHEYTVSESDVKVKFLKTNSTLELTPSGEKKLDDFIAKTPNPTVAQAWKVLLKLINTDMNPGEMHGPKIIKQMIDIGAGTKVGSAIPVFIIVDDGDEDEDGVMLNDKGSIYYYNGNALVMLQDLYKNKKVSLKKENGLLDSYDYDNNKYIRKYF